jgi:hypothetical protein
VGVGLDHAAAGPGDEVEGAAEGDGGDALAAVALVNEEAGETVVGKPGKPLLVLLSVVDVRQFLGGAVLAPGDGAVAVENEGGVVGAPLDAPLLEGAVAVGGVALLGVDGDEPGAPAAVPDTVWRSARSAKASQVSGVSALIV